MKTSSKTTQRKRMCYFILHLSLSLFFLSACITETNRVEPAEPVAAQFVSTIAGMATTSRATNSSWDNGDAIGISMVSNQTTNIVNNVANRPYTANTAGSFAPSSTADAIYLPDNGSKVDFIAYYPYLSTLTNLGSCSLNVGGNQQDKLPTLDLLYATTASTAPAGYDNTGTGQVAFTFRHQLTKLTMNVEAGDGVTASDLAGLTVTVKGLNTQSSFNLASGSLGAVSAITNITPHMTGSKYEAIILPQTIAANTVTVDFVTAAFGTFVWSVPAGTFDPEKDYTHTVQVSRTGIVVTGSIIPWGEIDGGNVTAE
jgi:hypothetical protein